MKKITTFLILIFGISVFAQIPNYVPVNGLIGWYPFTGNSNDQSGNNNNGLNNGASLINDRFNNPNAAYVFNGVNSFINVPTFSTLTYSPITISIWANFSSLCFPQSSNCWQMLIGRDAFGNTSQGAITLHNHSPNNLINKLIYYTGGGADISNITPNINSWQHIVFTYENSTTKWYINGVLSYTAPFSYISNSNIPFNIGSGGNRYFFNGSLDDIGIWNRALTTCEINQLYTSSISTISIQSSSNIICAGQTVSLNVIGGNTHTWSTGQNTSNITVTPTIITSYSVVSTTSAGCTPSAVTTLTINPRPIINITTSSICYGQSTTISANGANTYTWSNATISPSVIVSPTTTTSYSVTGTSTAGCISASAAVATVTVFALPQISVNSGTICNSQSFTLIPNGANTYTISGGNTIVSPTTTTSYSVTGTSTAGCISASVAVATVSVNQNPILSITGNTLLCTGETGTITVSGANAYAWSNGATSTSITINNTPNTYNYTVTGTGTNSCTASTTVQVLINACTSIAQNQNKYLDIYPNPASSFLNIGASDQAIGKTLKIFDAQSKLIQVLVLNTNNVLQLSDWAKGIYLIQVSELGISKRILIE